VVVRGGVRRERLRGDERVRRLRGDERVRRVGGERENIEWGVQDYVKL
jgi:hypothetical protein